MLAAIARRIPAANFCLTFALSSLMGVFIAVVATLAAIGVAWALELARPEWPSGLYAAFTLISLLTFAAYALIRYDSAPLRRRLRLHAPTIAISTGAAFAVWIAICYTLL